MQGFVPMGATKGERNVEGIGGEGGFKVLKGEGEVTKRERYV